MWSETLKRAGWHLLWSEESEVCGGGCFRRHDHQPRALSQKASYAGRLASAHHLLWALWE